MCKKFLQPKKFFSCKPFLFKKCSEKSFPENFFNKKIFLEKTFLKKLRKFVFLQKLLLLLLEEEEEEKKAAAKKFFGWENVCKKNFFVGCKHFSGKLRKIRKSPMRKPLPQRKVARVCMRASWLTIERWQRRVNLIDTVLNNIAILPRHTSSLTCVACISLKCLTRILISRVSNIWAYWSPA